VLEGLCRDTVIITNLGIREKNDERLKAIGAERWLEAGPTSVSIMSEARKN